MIHPGMIYIMKLQQAIMKKGRSIVELLVRQDLFESISASYHGKKGDPLFYSSPRMPCMMQLDQACMRKKEDPCLNSCCKLNLYEAMEASLHGKRGRSRVELLEQAKLISCNVNNLTWRWKVFHG